MRKRFDDTDIDKFLAARRRTEQWPKFPAPSKTGRDRRSSYTGCGEVDASFMSRLKQLRAATQNVTSGNYEDAKAQAEALEKAAALNSSIRTFGEACELYWERKGLRHQPL